MGAIGPLVDTFDNEDSFEDGTMNKNKNNKFMLTPFEYKQSIEIICL